MYQRRRARIVLAVLALFALVLVTLDVRAGDDGALHQARGWATTAFRPVQDGLVFLGRPVASTFSGIGEVFAVRTENARLREQVESLSERRRSMADLERENEELRRLLAMQERGAYETVAARAVGIAPSSFEWTITLDVGALHGIERGMPVINGDGLVGRIVQVTPGSSRVLLAIDPSFSSAARTSRTGEIGPIEGRGSDPMLMRPLDPAGDIDVGDEVVTSAYQGGVFPAGIPIGVVADTGEASARLTREITVRPYVDFTRLHHVLVVLSAPVEPIPPLVGTPELEFVPPPVSPFMAPDLPEAPPAPDDDDREDADTEDHDGATP